MQFLTSLIGGSENTYLTAAIALGIVLMLIIMGLWVLKAFFRASNRLALGRSRRLMIIEQVAIDQKRRMMIVRRDNVEHVILTGGPQDVVVETGIAVERPAASLPVGAPAAAALHHGAAHGPATANAAGVARPVTDALEAARPLKARPGGSSMNRLRKLSEDLSERHPPTSLRQTGLLRPVSRMTPAAVIPMSPDNSEHRRLDSATTGPANQSSGQTGFGGDGYRENGIKAEGN